MSDDETTFPGHSHAEQWDARYSEQPQMWSGEVNATTAAIAGTLSAGTVLDIGCGEGGDVLWFAQRGWLATGIDVSSVAISRARQAAQARGIAARWHVCSLEDFGAGRFDLVTASFLHSADPHFDRAELLRLATERVAAGGHLLAVSHVLDAGDATHHADPSQFSGPLDDLRRLQLDARNWTVVLAEVVDRDRQNADGTTQSVKDGVLLLRRLS